MAREMKDSGIEWIGEIPLDWDTVKLKRLAKIQTGNTPSKTENENYYSQDSGYLWIKAEDLGEYSPIESTAEYLSEDGIKYGRLFPKNTVYVCCIASIGKVGFCNIPASCNQQINGLIFHNAYWKFGFYITIAQELEYIVKASGNVMKIINSEKQSELICPLPKLYEQQRIADFLDTQCDHIDSIIEKTRAAIEEYKRLKQSVITQAVTKGIRPNREMKDSGIEWIGDIPKEWKIGKAKHYVSITNGSDPKYDGDIPVYGSGANSFKTCGEYKEGPCVLIGRKGATLHIPHYIDHNYWNVDTAFDVKPLKSYNLRYYYYTACCFDYKLYISQTTLPGMTQTNYENMFVPAPNLSEQTEIVAHLDEKTAAIDSLIQKKEQLITELEAYKKSLIYEYVTGKKEVPVHAH